MNAAKDGCDSSALDGIVAEFTVDVRTWPSLDKIEAIVQQENYVIANDPFFDLKRTVLASTQEELDQQYHYAELVWQFLVGFATEKNQFRSQIVQVIKRLMEVPRWQAALKGMSILLKKARMLHPDLQMAFGQYPEGKKKTKSSATGVLDRSHCCTCSNCAKPWAFKCKYTTPHYCKDHFRQSQLAAPISQDALAGWPECAPSGFDGEPIATDTHVKLRSTLPVQTQRLVASSTSQAAFKNELDQLNVNMDPDKVKRSTVDKAQELLEEIKQALQKDETHVVESLSSELGKLIPQDGFGKIATEEDVLKQVEILEVLDSLIASNELKSHDALSKYCDIGYLDPETEEGRLVRGMLMENLGSDDVDITHMDAFRVSRHEEEDREEAWANIVPSNNRVLLWHGSNNTKFVSILRNGLTLTRPSKNKNKWLKAPGGTFDYGIYFTDMVSKSLQYCGGSSNEVLLVLAEVCLGSMYCCRGKYGLCFDWNAQANAEQLGCHSTWGVGRIWPDPESSIYGTPDSMVPCCDIPLGEPVRVRCNDGTHPVLDYNEFIVYNPNQVRLRYLVRLRYAHADTMGTTPSIKMSASASFVQPTKKEVPCILMRGVEGSVLQEPYCRYARECGSSKLETTVRWQYYFDKKQTFDSTLPGWHSYGHQECSKIEKSYSDGDRILRIRMANGYEYNMDFNRMVQVNLSTDKTRTIRRKEVSFRRVAVPGGKSFKVSADLVQGETVDWTFEVEDDLRLDFKAAFTPASQPEGEPLTCVNIVNSTVRANSWSFSAPSAGSILLQWRNAFSLASARSLLVDWHREAPVMEPGQQFGGALDKTSCSAFDGVWTHGSISGSKLTWAKSGTVVGIRRIDDRAFTMDVNGKTVTAVLKDGEYLHWSDGEIWQREAGLEESKARALSDSRLLLRDHLSRHLSNNPDATYKSWIASLHPENVTLDPRLCTENGNEWMSLWRELGQNHDRLAAPDTTDERHGVCSFQPQPRSEMNREGARSSIVSSEHLSS